MLNKEQKKELKQAEKEFKEANKLFVNYCNDGSSWSNFEVRQLRINYVSAFTRLQNIIDELEEKK